jgi:hypothetical protein
LLKRLAAKCDVVVENFRPGTIEKWGLGYDELKKLNPRAILVRISAYGQDGPMREERPHLHVSRTLFPASRVGNERTTRARRNLMLW